MVNEIKLHKHSIYHTVYYTTYLKNYIFNIHCQLKKKIQSSTAFILGRKKKAFKRKKKYLCTHFSAISNFIHYKSLLFMCWIYCG